MRKRGDSILLIRVCEPIGQLHAKNVQPPVGLLHLAAVLEPLGYRVRVLDMLFDAVEVDEVVAIAVREPPRLIGLSIMSVNVGVFKRTARALARALPEVPIVAGGPHATAFPEECAATDGVTCVAIGEAEDTIRELVPLLLADEPFDHVLGIAFEKSGSVSRTERRPPLDPEILPDPSWHLVDMRRYWRHPSMTVKGAHPYFPLVSSRGCPYQCGYCHDVFGKKFRARSAGSLYAEILRLHQQYGVRDFELIDDVFNLDRARVHRFCRLVINSGSRFSFSLPNGVRGDILDEETIALLAEAGFDVISFAIETASPRLQRLVRKNNDLERLARNMEIAHQHGIFNYGFFMLGFPTETRDEMEATIRMAMEVEADVISFFRVIPFKSTALWEWVPEHIRQNPEAFDRAGYVLCSEGFNLSEVPDEEITKMQRAAYRRFYADPRRLLRIVRKNPRPLGLLSYSAFYLQNMFIPDSLNHKPLFYYRDRISNLLKGLVSREPG